jgi:hypothetical protein
MPDGAILAVAAVIVSGTFTMAERRVSRDGRLVRASLRLAILVPTYLALRE